MGKREKILIALMAAAIGYGAFEFFYSPAAREPAVDVTVKVDAARTLTENISQTISAAELKDDESYVLDVAASTWLSNPFYEWPVLEDTKEEALSEEEWDPMFYSGYMEMGRTRMAVINGIEYLTGEIIKGGRFAVLEITPEKVVVQSLKSLLEITIPYQDKFFVD